MKLSENIKELRKANNLRQEQLAEAMGVSAASVSKWETGQCAPELTVLMELADFFEVSVDALVGHDLSPDRVERLIGQMERAVKERDEQPAAELCERLLRNYPNSERVVQACADGCYKLFVYTGKTQYMEQCIAQTKRLMLLKRGEPDRDRLERVRDLANQYALLERWDEAKEHYEQSNVCGCSNAGIAACLLKQKKTEKAVNMLSDELMRNAFRAYQAANDLADGWIELGEPEKACSALGWIYGVLDAMKYNPAIMMTIQIKLAALYREAGRQEAALEAIREAAAQAKKSSGEPQRPAEFLQSEKEQEVLISRSDHCRLLAEVAQKMGAVYEEAVREALR